MISDPDKSLRSDIFSTLRMKGHVLHTYIHTYIFYFIWCLIHGTSTLFQINLQKFTSCACAFKSSGLITYPGSVVQAGRHRANKLICRRSIIVLSFDHQVCFHILITSWQLRVAICHFSHENVVPIAQEQNIICRKTRLDGLRMSSPF